MPLIYLFIKETNAGVNEYSCHCILATGITYIPGLHLHWWCHSRHLSLPRLYPAGYVEPCAIVIVTLLQLLEYVLLTNRKICHYFNSRVSDYHKQRSTSLKNINVYHYVVKRNKSVDILLRIILTMQFQGSSINDNSFGISTCTQKDNKQNPETVTQNWGTWIKKITPNYCDLSVCEK